MVIVRERDEDAAWQEIVDNFGDRATLDGDGDQGAGPEPVPGSPERSEDSGESGEPDGPPDVLPAPPQAPAAEERYVPPPPPPLPRPRGPRGLAWVGAVGSPALLLVLLLTGQTISRLVATVLVAAFLCGFGYLVWTMPRGPRDPWDDGARV